MDRIDGIDRMMVPTRVMAAMHNLPIFSDLYTEKAKFLLDMLQYEPQYFQ